MTDRNLAEYGRFVNNKGQMVSVQRSSCVEPSVWVFQESENKDAIHLNINNARMLMALLDEWITDQET